MLPDDNYRIVRESFENLLVHYHLDWGIAQIILDRDDWTNMTCVVNLINRWDMHTLGIHFWYATHDEVLVWEPFVEGRIRYFLAKRNVLLPDPLHELADVFQLSPNGLLPEYMRPLTSLQPGV